MEKAIIGRKLGMSQIFTPEGKVIPVTVILAGPCPVLQRKTVEVDGYSAVKVGFGAVKASKVTKPNAGEFKKAGAQPTKIMREFKADPTEEIALGSVIKCSVFNKGDKVDVVGTSRGRGFTGTVQRWNSHIGPKGHGSGYHRGVGSLGANSDPSRVFKNKHMPGQYGSERVTIQNLEVVKIDEARNLLLVRGGIPGAKGNFVIVKQSVKA